MKHAGTESLDALEDLLVEIRKLDCLKEKKRGTFYLKSSGFIHFHEDAAGLFADLRLEDGWTKFRVSTGVERKKFLKFARATLAQRSM